MSEQILIFTTGLAVLMALSFFLYLQIDRNNRIIMDRFRFRYFELRDRLALLVVEGKLDEDSWEYKQVVDVINFHIATVESRSISDIIKQLVAYHSSAEERRKVKIFKRKTEHPEVIAILSDLFKTTLRLLKRNSRVQFWLIRRATEKRQDVKAYRSAAPIKYAADNLTEYQEDLAPGII